MKLLDAVVAMTIVAILAWPAVRKLASRLPASQGSPVELWRQKWTATLITLLDQIEAGQGQFTDKATAVRLGRELLWEVIGGDGPPSSPK